MWNKCSKIESKGKHQGEDKEINDTEIIKIIHKTKHTHTHTHTPLILSWVNWVDIFELCFSFTVCPRIKR